MPRPTPLPPGTTVTTYLTRNLPVALLARVRQQAEALDTTVEDAVNLALELGVGVLERQAHRSAR